MNAFQFILQNHSQVLELTWEHLQLVGIATFCAVLIGIPLGILIAHRPRFNKPVLMSANIIQTIPSLALFRVSTARAVAGCPLRQAGDSGPHSLCLSAYYQKHVYRDSRSRSRRHGSGSRHGTHRGSAFVSGGTAARDERDPLRCACRYRHFSWAGNNRRRDRRWRFGRVHLSRLSHGRQQRHSSRSHSRCTPGADG